MKTNNTNITVKQSLSWGAATSRFVNWVELKDQITNKVIVVWNTHFDNKSQYARENSVPLLLSYTSQFSNDVPQILTGDFNTHAETNVIKSLKEGGWVDTYEEFHGPGDPGLTAHRFGGEVFAATEEGKNGVKLILYSVVGRRKL